MSFSIDQSEAEQCYRERALLLEAVQWAASSLYRIPIANTDAPHMDAWRKLVHALHECGEEFQVRACEGE